MKNKIINSNKIKSEIETLSVELATLPEGHLNRRGRYYYHVIKREGIGITKNKALIQLLCRKKYILARLEQLQSNLSASFDLFDNRLPSDLIKSFSKTYQEVPISYFYHPSMDAWLREKPDSNPYPIKGGYRTTYDQVHVRSKSEQIIGSLLEKYGIPYRYEPKLRLGSKTKYPDFDVKNPFTGKEIIWEHFGGAPFNQLEYEDSMHEKIKLYSQANYVPNDTIIFTLEIDIEHHPEDIIENIIL